MSSQLNNAGFHQELQEESALRMQCLMQLEITLILKLLQSVDKRLKEIEDYVKACQEYQDGQVGK